MLCFSNLSLNGRTLFDVNNKNMACLKVDKPVYPNHAQLYNLLYLMFYIDYSLSDLVYPLSMLTSRFKYITCSSEACW